MLPKIPYSMQKNKSMTVPIGNYNISSNFSPGDIADSYGISARKFPRLTTRKTREKVLECGEILGMTVFNGEIVTVRRTGDGNASIYVGDTIVSRLSGKKERRLAVINTKLVVYPDKVYIEKVDGAWAAGELGVNGTYQSSTQESSPQVEFESNCIKVSDQRADISGFGLNIQKDDFTDTVTVSGGLTRSFRYDYLLCRYGHIFCGGLSLGSGNELLVQKGDKYSFCVDFEPNDKISLPIISAGVELFCGSNEGFAAVVVRQVEKIWGYPDDPLLPEQHLYTRVHLSLLEGKLDPGYYHMIRAYEAPNTFSLYTTGDTITVRTFGCEYEVKVTQTGNRYISIDNRNIFSDVDEISILGWSWDDVQKIQSGDTLAIDIDEKNTYVVKAVEVDAVLETFCIICECESELDLSVGRDTQVQISVQHAEKNAFLQFRAGDAVSITGCENIPVNNISFVISRIIGNNMFVSSDIFISGISDSDITIERRIPDLDFICEKDNRLYGVNNLEKTIYVSALGDPTNMYTYEGVSTDSFTVAVGGESDFTGCCKYAESVLFFKENKIYKLTGYTPADFAIYSYDVDGLQAGSDTSPVVINEVLYYKGKNGIFAYTGGIPTLISENFGERIFENAAAGTDGVSYYVSMVEGEEKYLLSYNTRLGLWVREGDERYIDFVRTPDGLYGADEAGNVYKMNVADDASEREWMVQLVPFYETIEGKKTYSRLLMRVELPRGSYMIIEVRSDDGAWCEAGKIVGANKGIIPIRLPIARCDKFEIRLSGKGEFTIHDILREYHVGSEV